MASTIAAYLPDSWQDDARMTGLMSMFKLKSVNPNDWETKMTFWTDLIERSCQQLHDPVISLSSLKSRFRRRDQLPAGLDTVLEHMFNSESWLAWGVNSLITRPISWLFSGSTKIDIQNDQLVHLPTVKEIANKIVHRQQEDSLVDDSTLSDVIEVSALYERVQDICANHLSFELALNQLIKDGSVSVGSSSLGEKIVKFRDIKERGPVRVTETDTNIHDVRRAMNKLEKEVGRLEENAKKCETEVRAHLRSGNKLKAKQMLRQKMRILKQIKEKDAQYDQLLNIMHRLAETRQNKDIFDAYNAGVKAFKQNLLLHGLSPEKIDETMENIQETLNDHGDIMSALAQGPSGIADSSADDALLEDELEQLIADDDRRREPKYALPSVPLHEPEVIIDEPASKVSAKRDRLMELRRQLAPS